MQKLWQALLYFRNIKICLLEIQFNEKIKKNYERDNKLFPIKQSPLCLKAATMKALEFTSWWMDAKLFYKVQLSTQVIKPTELSIIFVGE